MKVRYSYLKEQFENCDPILKEIKELVLSEKLTLGTAVDEFEKRFSDFIGARFAIGVGSGTDALFLSLKALGIGEYQTMLKQGYQDEVITAANTFVATAGAIETAGAKIVFVDCNEKYVIDPLKIERAITERTKAILPVHFSGQPSDMEAIMKIAHKHKLHVVEDACCAIDAESSKSLRCGTIGATAAYSLHPLKNLNIWGDGGVITTNSPELNDQLRLLRNHGMLNRDEYAFYAYNSRLDSLQSVVGKHLLKDVKWITDRRIENANRYDEAFKELGRFITIPPRAKSERHVYHMYMLLVKNRDELDKHLRSQGIDSKVHYPIPLHLQPASKKLGYKNGDFPIAESQAKNILSLPVHQHLSSEQIEFVISCVKDFYKHS